MKHITTFASDEHAHKCPNKKCGFVWHHKNLLLSKENTSGMTDNAIHCAYDKAHCCPQCGTAQTHTADPGTISTCMFNGITLTSENAEVKEIHREKLLQAFLEALLLLSENDDR